MKTNIQNKKQSTTRKVLGGTASVFSFKMAEVVIGFLTNFILITHLNIFDYGLLMLALSVYKIGDTFLDFGVRTLVLVEVAIRVGKKRFEELKRLIRDYVLFVISMGVLLSIILYIASSLLSPHYSFRVVDLVKLASVLIFIKAFQNIFIVMFYGHSKFTSYALVSFIETFSRLILVLILIVALAGGVIDVMIIYVLSTLISMFLMLPSLLAIYSYLKNVKSAQGPSILKKLLFGHGKYVVLTQPVKRLADNIPVWVIQFLSGVESVAIYSVAEKVYIPIRESMSSIESVIIPTMAEEVEKNKKKHVLIFHKSIKLAFFIAVPLSILTIILAPSIFGFLGFDQYYGSIPILQVLSISLIVTALGISQRSAFYSLRAQKYRFYTLLIYLACMIIFGIMLTSLYGPLGMAIACFMAHILLVTVALLILAKLNKDLKFNPRELFRLDQYDRNFLQKLKNKLKN